MLTLEDYPKRAWMKRTEIPADVWKTGEPLGARRHHASRRTMGVGAWFLPRTSTCIPSVDGWFRMGRGRSHTPGCTQVSPHSPMP